MTVYDLHHVTPLGVWFWDALTGAPVGDALDVVAWPLDVQGEPSVATRTPSGVRAFHGLAGLRRVEYPLGDEDPLGAPVQTGRFAVTVDDPSRRFSPMTLELEAPHAGLAGPGSPPGGPVFLFSAADRAFPAAFGVVRADIADRATGEPAAYARVDVLVAGRRWAGVASESGAVAIGFPYPTFGGPPPASPPAPVAPGPQTWPVVVEVRFAPEALEFPLPGRAPELTSILGQPRVAVWPDMAGTPVDALQAELTFGSELVLRTAGASSLLTGETSP